MADLAQPAAVDRSTQAGRLTAEERIRYSRHLLLPDVGERGQRRLKESRVLVVGAGGLGSPVSLYLAAAGVGEIGLAEFDRVDRSNLQRQILYGTSDIGSPKLVAAVRRLHDLNPGVRVAAHDGPLDSGNVGRIVPGYDLVVDGTDNFATRYLVNDACVRSGIPNVHGSVYRFEGQASVFVPGEGPCYRCLFRDPPAPGEVPSCGEGGVLGVLPGLVGLIQATETLKLLLGVGQPLVGRLLVIDALALEFREVSVERDPGCPTCGSFADGARPIAATFACSGPLPPPERPVPLISVEELQRLLTGPDPPALVDVREAAEWQIGHLPGAIHLPLSRFAQELHRLDRSRSIVLYCRSGLRSRTGVERLLATGFTRVSSLEGGLDAWPPEDLPTN